MESVHKNQISFEELKKSKEKYKKIFFYRICGTGMGAAACLLKEKGLYIAGGDTTFAPPVSDYLKSTQIPCYDLSNISQEQLKEFDLIVVGNVVPRGGEDAQRIESSGLPFTSFPCALGAFVLEDQNVVGIAGTHGKTTTTFFLTQIFENLGFEPGYFIGGVLEGRPPSKLGSGQFFFIESDEYDSSYFQKVSKFHYYCIDHLILTSLEFDHADIFANLSGIESQFENLVPQITKSFIFSADYSSSMKIYHQFKDQEKKKEWILYGEKSDLGPLEVRPSEKGTIFKLLLSNEPWTFTTNLVGFQNILNLAASILFAHSQGISGKKIQEAVTNLKMVKRRQEVKGNYKGALMIDDFAHHPRAVSLTLESIKIKYPHKKVVVIFEPTSATARSNIFQDEFAEGLLLADHVIIIKPSRKNMIKNYTDIDCSYLINKIKTIKNIEGSVVENLNDLKSKIDEYLFKNKLHDNLILTLSNGTLLGLWESIFKNENHS